MKIRQGYSANVRAEVARRGKRAKDMAAAVGVSPATWRRRMRNDDWRITELELLATALDVPLDTLTRRVA